MPRKSRLRPSLLRLEEKCLPSSGGYPDAWRTGVHDAYVTRAEAAPTPVLFLGDSITTNWKGSGLATWDADFYPIGATSFGMPGDHTQDLTWRIDNGEVEGKPKVAVVMVGINNLLAQDGSYNTIEGIESVVAAIHTHSDQSKILLLGILPTNYLILNTQAAQVNDWLGRDAKSWDVTYLDLTSKLMGGNGLVKPGLTIDGIHPDATGYADIAPAIDQAIVQLLGPPGGSKAMIPSPASSTSNKPAPSDSPASIPVTFELLPILLDIPTPDQPIDVPTHHKTTTIVPGTPPTT